MTTKDKLRIIMLMKKIECIAKRIGQARAIINDLECNTKLDELQRIELKVNRYRIELLEKEFSEQKECLQSELYHDLDFENYKDEIEGTRRKKLVNKLFKRVSERERTA